VAKELQRELQRTNLQHIIKRCCRGFWWDIEEIWYTSISDITANSLDKVKNLAFKILGEHCQICE
jgi:hypothetical protein